MRQPSCQLVVSAAENRGSREGSWVFGWEGLADAVCVVVVYRWAAGMAMALCQWREAGLRFYSRNTGSHICSYR